MEVNIADDCGMRMLGSVSNCGAWGHGGFVKPVRNSHFPGVCGAMMAFTARWPTMRGTYEGENLMLTIHHLGASQSERIVWLCEELEIPYTLKRYTRDPVTRIAPPEYKALHPAGTAPIISDGDMVLAESNAIVDYIIAKHGGGRLSVPANDPEFAHYLFWLHFANGTLMPAALVRFMLAMPGVSDANGVMKGFLGRIDKAFDMCEARLSKADYFGGSQFTAADIMMVYMLNSSRSLEPRDYSRHPHIADYLKRVTARHAYQRAMQKAEPDRTLPPA
jgi:glutathione S-transferase